MDLKNHPSGKKEQNFKRYRSILRCIPISEPLRCENKRCYRNKEIREPVWFLHNKYSIFYKLKKNSLQNTGRLWKPTPGPLKTELSLTSHHKRNGVPKGSPGYSVIPLGGGCALEQHYCFQGLKMMVLSAHPTAWIFLFLGEKTPHCDKEAGASVRREKARSGPAPSSEAQAVAVLQPTALEKH